MAIDTKITNEAVKYSYIKARADVQQYSRQKSQLEGDLAGATAKLTKAQGVVAEFEKEDWDTVLRPVVEPEVI